MAARSRPMRRALAALRGACRERCCAGRGAAALELPRPRTPSRQRLDRRGRTSMSRSASRSSARRRAQHEGDPAQAARHGAQGHPERPDVGVPTATSTALHRDLRRERAQSRHAGVLAPLFRASCIEAFGDCMRRASRCWTSEQPIASVMNFYFRDEVLPYYGGGTAAARQRAGNDFMYWEVMRRAADRGCRLFDFGRSKLGTGAFAFKKNWGFEPAAAALPLPAGARARRSRTTTRSTRNTGCSSRPGSVCRCRSPTCSARRSCAGSAERRCAICCS